MKTRAQMFWLKACKRCGGDLYEAPDFDAPYVRCLQCTRELNGLEEQYLRIYGRMPEPQQVPAPAVKTVAKTFTAKAAKVG